MVQSTSLSQEDLTIAEARAHVLTPSGVPGEFETLDGWRVFVVGNEVSYKPIGDSRCTLEAVPMGEEGWGRDKTRLFCNAIDFIRILLSIKNSCTILQGIGKHATFMSTSLYSI